MIEGVDVPTHHAKVSRGPVRTLYDKDLLLTWSLLKFGIWQKMVQVISNTFGYAREVKFFYLTPVRFQDFLDLCRCFLGLYLTIFSKELWK